MSIAFCNVPPSQYSPELREIAGHLQAEKTGIAARGIGENPDRAATAPIAAHSRSPLGHASWLPRRWVRCNERGVRISSPFARCTIADAAASFTRFRLLQIALEDAYVIESIVAAISPQVARSEANIIGRLHGGLHAVPGSIWERIWGRNANNDPNLAAYVRWHPHMTRSKVALYAYFFADCEGLRRRWEASRSNGSSKWERASDERLKSLTCHEVLLYEEARDRRQMALVVRCPNVSAAPCALWRGGTRPCCRCAS